MTSAPGTAATVPVESAVSKEGGGPRMWWTLAITSIALFMVTLDNLIVTNALPTIQREFNATVQGLEWTVNAYTLTFAVLLPPVAYLVLDAVPTEAAGQASGANNAIRELGGVFGVAAMTTIFATYGSYASGDAFTDGLIPAVWVGAAIVAVGAVISLLVPGRKRKQPPEVIPTIVPFPEQALFASPNGPDAEPAIQHAEEHDGDADAFPCPVCMGHGWFPFEPPQDPRTSTCPRCHGHGKVLTGSHVAGHTVRDCPDCTGQGYVEVRGAYEPLSVTSGGSSESPAS
jgi:hypothetical protein